MYCLPRYYFYHMYFPNKRIYWMLEFLLSSTNILLQTISKVSAKFDFKQKRDNLRSSIHSSQNNFLRIAAAPYLPDVALHADLNLLQTLQHFLMFSQTLISVYILKHFWLKKINPCNSNNFLMQYYLRNSLKNINPNLN